MRYVYICSAAYGPAIYNQIGVIEADNLDEALGKASRMLERFFPYSKGWAAHASTAVDPRTGILTDIERIVPVKPYERL